MILVPLFLVGGARLAQMTSHYSYYVIGPTLLLFSDFAICSKRLAYPPSHLKDDVIYEQLFIVDLSHDHSKPIKAFIQGAMKAGRMNDWQG